MTHFPEPAKLGHNISLRFFPKKTATSPYNKRLTTCNFLLSWNTKAQVSVSAPVICRASAALKLHFENLPLCASMKCQAKLFLQGSNNLNILLHKLLLRHSHEVTLNKNLTLRFFLARTFCTFCAKRRETAIHFTSFPLNQSTNEPSSWQHPNTSKHTKLLLLLKLATTACQYRTTHFALTLSLCTPGKSPP